MGIDIGTVDEVVQIDATHSVSSLIQRVGRSGRKAGTSSNLFLYATNKWSLLQSLACWLLYKEGFIDPPHVSEKPYDILLHQILSIVKGHSGILRDKLIGDLKSNYAFSSIETGEIEEILDHLVTEDILEKLQNEIIIGVTGERIVNHRDFYSVFKTEGNLKVVHAGNTIGEVPISPQTIEGQNIFLAARIWKIKFVDEKAKRIEVIPANDGKKPLFFGGGSAIHHRIREKMSEVIFCKDNYAELDPASMSAIEVLRGEFKGIRIINPLIEKPIISKEGQLSLYSFTGTRINRTLNFLFTKAGIENRLFDDKSRIDLSLSKADLQNKWKELTATEGIDSHLISLLASSPTLLDFSKWGGYLPLKYQASILKEKYFDFENTQALLKSMTIVEHGNNN